MKVASDHDWDWHAIRVRCLKEALRMTGTRADAEDVVQEALVRAWRMRDQCQDRGRPTPWVLQITRNEALRHHGRRHEQPLDPHGVWPEAAGDASTCEAVLDRVAVQGVMRALGADERALLELRYGSDLTQPAMAQQLGVPEGTVKVRLHRARARLRHAWIDR